MGACRYLFVVKNSKSESFSRSDDHERRLIHRHVQIGSIRRSLPTSQPSDNCEQLPIIEVKPSIKYGRSLKHADAPSGKAPGAFASWPSSDPRLLCRCFVASKRPCPFHTIPLMSAIEQHVIDPFASTTVNVDRQAHSLLQYFIHVSHPRTWHSEVQEDHSYTFQRDALTLVRGCLENEVHFYSLLASMASQMQYFEHIKQDEDRTNLLATKAIVAIRTYLRITPTIDQRLIFDIHQMAVTEFYRHELESAYVHLKAVRALLPHVGGIEGIDPALREWIVIGDGYLAAELLSKPLFPASCFDPEEIHQDNQIIVGRQSHSAGQCLQEPKYRRIFPAQMQLILLDMTATVQAIQQQSETLASGKKAPMATLHWFLLRTTALRHRLLDLHVEDVKANALKIALILWLFLVVTVTGRQRTCKVLSSKLKSSLQSTIKDNCWAGYEDGLMWVLLVGAMSSSAADLRWYLIAIRQLEHKHRQTTTNRMNFRQDKLASYARRFFYLEGVQKQLLQALVSDLNALPRVTAT